MNHPFQESLNRIEERLDMLCKEVSKKQSQFSNDMFIDNEEFRQLMKITSATACTWREEGVISYSQIRGKIYYRVQDIINLLDKHSHPSKKK